ncbi:MAG: HesA/MoeB/ThiF family protein, partial [Bacteroidota bacterium]
TDEIGQLKLEVAALKLKRLNADVKIFTYPERLEKKNAFSILSKYDLVIDGTDNFATRYLVNDACVVLNKPLIYGAVSQYEGQVAVFYNNSFAASNYRTIFPHPPNNGEVLNCAEAGVIGMLPGIIGSMQAAEVIKLITGIGAPLVNKLLTYNVLTHETYVVEILPVEGANELWPKNETEFLAMNYADVCGTAQNSIIEIDAQQLHLLSKLSHVMVIDVREKGELPLMKNFAHQQIPMSVFRENISAIDKQTVVLFCQHGVRSLYAAELVQQVFGNQKELYNLKGGVVKWADELGV